MLTHIIIAAFAAIVAATYTAQVVARAWQAIAFDVASYATTPAPTPGAALAHYINRFRFRSARAMLRAADAITRAANQRID